MTEKGNTDDEQTTKGGNGYPVRRRDVMKAAGTASVVGLGFAGTASAQGDCDVACQAGSGPDNCSCAVDSDCEFISKTQVGGDTNCAEVSVPEGTDLAVVKASTDCIVFGDDPGEDLNPGGTSTICISEDCQGISHIEFYDCPCPFDADLCLDEYSCCTVSGTVTGLQENCTATVRVVGCSGKEQDVTGPGPNDFSISIDCECNPEGVELVQPDGTVIDSDSPGTLTCSLDPEDPC